MSDELGIRFDIDNLGGGAYGLASWQVIWRAVEPATIGPATLREGDTMATLSGQEEVFCVAVNTSHPGGVEALRAALEASPAFQRVAATPPFADPTTLASEPLVDAGRVDAAGNVEGMWALAGLTAAQEEHAVPPEPPLAPPMVAPLSSPAPMATAPVATAPVATAPSAPVVPPGPTQAGPLPERRVPIALVGGLALLGALAGYFVTAAVTDDESTPTVETRDAASGQAGVEPGSEESPDEAPTAPAQPQGIAVVESSAGPLPVLSIMKTDEYPTGCVGTDEFSCTTSDFGARVVVITFGPAPGLNAQETMGRLEGESFSDNEALDATIQEPGFDALDPFSLLSRGETIELAYAYLFSEDALSVTFTWPGNPPVELTF